MTSGADFCKGPFTNTQRKLSTPSVESEEIMIDNLFFKHWEYTAGRSVVLLFFILEDGCVILKYEILAKRFKESVD